MSDHTPTDPKAIHAVDLVFDVLDALATDPDVDTHEVRLAYITISERLDASNDGGVL